MNLWHGSDRRFDKFDMNKIGSGDGKTLGGWGIYFSDSKSVADRYYLPKGQIDMWQVDVRPGRMFDFDEYDDSQYQKVLASIAGILDDYDVEQFENDFRDTTGRQIYEWLTHTLGGEREASEFLLSIGYDGVTMKDRWETTATNYIMFSDRRISGKVDEEGLNEEGEASPGPGYSTLDSVPGMGAPVLPTRTSFGSGDVPMPAAPKKRVKRFKEFGKSKKKKR